MSSNRRDFLRVSALAGAALILEFHLPALAEANSLSIEPNAWIKVTSEGRYVFILDRAEMGQGVMTALPILLAEEFDIDPKKLEVENAPADTRYSNADLHMQITGGSTSVHASWLPLRNAGASARQLFIDAAALKWGCDAKLCTTNDGTVIGPDQKKIAYHQLIDFALKCKVKEAPLKDPKGFKFIGRVNERRENLVKVTGRATYGIDVRVDNVCVAMVLRAPCLGAKLKGFRADKIKSVRGFVGAFRISTGVAVVTKNTWLAKKARELLEVDWEIPAELQSSEGIRQQALREAKHRGSEVFRRGNFLKGFEGAEEQIEVVYECPYLSHSTMEPQNCTANVTENFCEVWAPTQSPALAHKVCRDVTGFDADKIRVNTTYLGGGFGRRLAQDYVREAVEISQAAGVPVRVQWTREDDMQYDLYRPCSYHVLRGGVSANNAVAWSHHVITQSIMSDLLPEWAPEMLMPNWMPAGMRNILGAGIGTVAPALMSDPTAFEGAGEDVAYAIDNISVTYSKLTTGVPVGFWRSVGHSYTGFVVESFIDELAHMAKVDAVEFRVKLLSQNPELRETLLQASHAAGWANPLPPNCFRGVAAHSSFRSHAATVAEVQITGDSFKVTRIVTAIQCGRVINPDMVRAQIESATIFALSAALYGEITWNEGRVQQSNFHNQPVLRTSECPQIDVVLVKSDSAPTGVGEPGVPPVAPAVANAIFKGSGKRLRTLPLRLGT